VGVIPLAGIKAVVGIALILSQFSVGFSLSLFMEPLMRDWYWSHRTDTFTRETLGSILFLAFTTAGLALYIADRSAFWEVEKGHVVRVFLILFGAALITLGVLFGCFMYCPILPTLWLITGILLIADCIKYR